MKPPPPPPLLYRPTTTTAAAAMANHNKKLLRRALLVGLSVGLPLMQLRFARGGYNDRRPDPLVVSREGGGLLLALPSVSSLLSGAGPSVVGSARGGADTDTDTDEEGRAGPGGRGDRDHDHHQGAGAGAGEGRREGAGGGDGRVMGREAEVQWLDRGAFPDVRDFFSASWLMSMDNFLRTNVSAANMATVEAGCFGAFRGRTDRLLMSLDWLDFCVEHMSKWWRVLNCPHDPAALNWTKNVLLSYVARTNGADTTPSTSFHHGDDKDSPLRPTIALIAFQPFRSNRYDKDGDLEPKYRALTVASLAATISSLLRIGVGRVVVVGYGVVDEPVVRDAFHVLDPAASCGAAGGSGNGDGRACVVRGTELAFARVTDDMVKTLHSKVNLPRAALAGLMRAKQDQLGGEDDEEWRRTWLGPNPERWRYVYLTEPDTLLHTRPSTLRHLQTQLDEGRILVPHRFQPIPHEADAGHLGVKNLVTTKFKAPIALQSVGVDPQQQQHACCDAQEGRYRPGRNPDVDDGCRQPFFWWQCGYYKTSGNHTRLDKYGLIRLSDGTGVVTLAGNEQGRRCVPNKVGRCEIKTRSD